MRPCFGLSLQTGVQFIAVIDIINASLVIITVLTCQEWYSGRMVVIGMEATYIVAGGILAHGASKRCTIICKYWIVFAMLHSIVILSFIGYQWLDGISKWDTENTREETLIAIFYLVAYRAYAVYVTYKFIAEIVEFGGINYLLMQLSDKEVEEFLYGTLVEDSGTQIATDLGQGDCSKSLPSPLRKAYDKKYEITLQQLEIEPIILGKGKYGQINRGFLFIPPTNAPQFHRSRDSIAIEFEKKRVAVKTLLDSDANLIYFKSLLSELKIMIYLGEHPNIVTLIGVCTAEIRQKHLWIVLELCELGSLHGFLQSCHGFANSAFKPAQRLLDLKDTYKWAMQVAQALEYMGSKHVVHGDISTRNILLTSARDAKVSDFGLSRKLMQSGESKFWDDVPLPWRWMAIESLQKLQFSARSDVWSFGVALWEIFTFGETPFLGAKWNVEFIKQLTMGCRLLHPKEAPNEVYEIMLNCWKRDPSKRPSFSELIEEFKNKL